ncbi:MAG TPA: TonB-dependent receptor [Caulobacteraceae bacterium]|nr:TonB-dependent receptor [Caulobacteraceae bacterium]
MIVHTKKMALAGAALSALALGMPIHAFADEQATAQAPAGSAIMQTGEVIVTAQKHDQVISKTPLAVSAVTTTELRQADVTSVVQLTSLVPSLTVNSTGQGVYIGIRGVTTTDTTSKGDPGINFNTDGVPVARAEEQALGFFDLQRVEVLNGPQGTLYGKDSTGGAINVITNAPAFHTDGYASVTFGNYGTRNYEAMYNLPVNDHIALRAAVAGNYHLGYFNVIQQSGDFSQGTSQKPGDQNDFAARLSALIRFNDVTTLRVTNLVGQRNGVGYPQGGSQINVNSSLQGNGTLNIYSSPIIGHDKDQFNKIYGQLDTGFGPVHLSYLGSYSHYHTNNMQVPYVPYENLNGTRLLVRDNYNADYQEIRFSNQNPGKLIWSAGGNYWQEVVTEDGHDWEYANTFNIPPPALAGMVAANINLNDLSVLNLLNKTTHTSYSAFFHGIYAITDQLHATAGVRWGHDNTTRVGTLAVPWFSGPGPIPWMGWPNTSGGLCTGTQDCVGPANNGSGTSEKVTYTAGLDYQIDPTQMVYANISTGYKAGGFNDIQTVSASGVATPGPYGPEEMTAYEAGYKLRQSSALQFTSALYYYDYSEMQLAVPVQINGQNAVGHTILSPSKLYGIENSATFALSPNDVFTAELDYEHSWYVHYMAGLLQSYNLSGQALDHVPEWVVGGGYTHTWELAGGAVVKFHANTRYTSSYLLTNNQFSGGGYSNAVLRYTQLPFTRTDANLTYTSENGKFDIEAFVTNLENKVQMTSGPGGDFNSTGGNQGPTFGHASITEPRFFGIRIDYHL